MKNIKKYYFVFALSMVAFYTSFYAQEKHKTDYEVSKLLSVATSIMNEARNCALITVDNENRPRIRMMDPFAPEEDFTVWFGTNVKSRKVKQIRNNPNVTLYYLDKQGSGYVMIQGTAELITSPFEKEKHWKEGWQQFYPDRENNYILIKVRPRWLEVVSYTHGLLGDSITWQPPKVVLDHKDR